LIGDVKSGVLTRRMTKTTNEQGFISAVYEGKTHEDLHTCMFACFLSQEEPKKVWTLVDLPYGKRAIGTKWVYKNKKDERGMDKSQITRKQSKIEQARTRESEEFKKKPKEQSRSQKSQASVKISQEKSKSVKDGQ
ncbi:hypothetical protein Tco_0723453, partial [Tanacetum coccineum]